LPNLSLGFWCRKSEGGVGLVFSVTRDKEVDVKLRAFSMGRKPWYSEVTSGSVEIVVLSSADGLAILFGLVFWGLFFF